MGAGCPAVAVGHLVAVPEGVDVGVAVVDPRGHTLAVAEDAITAVDVLEVVERLGRAEVGVNGGGLAVARRAVAPRVVGVGDVAAGRRAVVHVAGAAVAVRGVGQRVAAAGLRGVDGHRAGVDAGAGALDVPDLVCLVQHRSRAGVDDHRQEARRLVGLDAVDLGLPRQARGGLAGVDDQLGRADLVDLAGECLLGRGLGLRDRQLGRGADGDRGGLRNAGTGESAAGGVVDDEVAAEHPETLVRAVVADVRRAVGVDDRAGRLELVAGGGPDRGLVLVNSLLGTGQCGRRIRSWRGPR